MVNSMDIVVGSTNPAKVKAVQEVFPSARGMKVASGVSDQPMSDEETRVGALRRARACLEQGASIGIGLEGGVMESEVGLLSVSWGALVDKDGCEVIASSARYPLPVKVAQAVRNGEELGDVLDTFTDRKDVRKKEGAIGVFSDGEMTRSEHYVHMVRLLAGQYRYTRQNS